MVGADLRAARRREPSCQPGTGRLGDPTLPTPLILSASTTVPWKQVVQRHDPVSAF